jgi:hypothetical protein
MELIIGLIVIAVVGYFVFFHKKAEAVAEPVAEYKVETPTAPVVAEPAPAPVVVEGAGEVAVPAKAPRKPRATPAKKTAVKKAPAKAKATEAPAKKDVVRTTARSKKV